jgi:DNA segregation ATPase FtsK/SpoIIIE-like protein
MKKKLSPVFVAAGIIVALSLFVILSMLFYTPSDHLWRASELAKEDNLRFHVAHLFFGTLGLGAYIGWIVVLAWAIVVFYRESAGELLLRGVSLGVAVLSGAALADMLGSNNLGGDLGFAVASVMKGSLGAVIGSVLMSGLFLASLAFATEFGFLNQIRAAHRILTEPREEKAAPDLVRGFNEGAEELLLRDETDLPAAGADLSTGGAGLPVEADSTDGRPTERAGGESREEPEEPGERTVISSSPLHIETERLEDDLLIGPGPARRSAADERILVRETDLRPAEAGLAVQTLEEAEDEFMPAPPPPVPMSAVAPSADPVAESPEEFFVDTGFDLVEHEIEAAEEAPEPEPATRWRPALESVFEALIGPAAAPLPPPAPAAVAEVTLTSEPAFLLDDEITILADEEEEADWPEPVSRTAAMPPESPPAVAVEEPPMELPAESEPVELPAESEPVEMESEPEVFAEAVTAEVLPEPPAAPAALTPAPVDRGGDDEALLPFMREAIEPAPAPSPDVLADAPPTAPERSVLPVLEDLAEASPKPKSLFRRRKPEPAPAAQTADPLLDEAASIFLERGRASVVLLQRRLDIGYTRASRIVEALAAKGLVGPLTESGSREVLLSREDWEARKLS